MERLISRTTIGRVEYLLSISLTKNITHDNFYDNTYIAGNVITMGRNCLQPVKLYLNNSAQWDTSRGGGADLFYVSFLVWNSSEETNSTAKGDYQTRREICHSHYM